MKIVHLYAKNLDIFTPDKNDVGWSINASTKVSDIIDSLYNFNVRNVLGLVVFANPITKNCLRLIKAFDSLFVFDKLPIVVISDNASELVADGTIKVKNSRLFALDSEENTISDIDVRRVFSTLLICNSEIYDLEPCGFGEDIKTERPDVDSRSLEMSDELRGLLKDIGI